MLAGSPTGMAATASVSASTTSSYRLRVARMRVWATQAWPLFMVEAAISSGMIASRSASSQMMAADLPPSSNVHRRSSSPQAAPILRPAAVEPVKLTLSTSGWVTRCWPVSRPAGTMLTTPSGTPASMHIWARALALSGVSGAGLSTIVDPLASAGASLSIEMNSGTFHGTMPAQTPTGSWRTRAGPIMPSSHLLEGEASGQLGEVVERHAGGTHLAEVAEQQWAAHLGGDQVGQVVGPFQKERIEPVDHVGPLGGGRAAPVAVECTTGGGDRSVDVGGRPLRGGPQLLFGQRARSPRFDRRWRAPPSFRRCRGGRDAGRT
jgi:hypothetical protein